MDMSIMDELHQTVQLLKNKYLCKAKPHPGLVPQSGDWKHPGRWVRPATSQSPKPKSNSTFEELSNKYHAIQNESAELWALLGTHKVNEPKIRARIKKLERADDAVRAEMRAFK